MNGTQLGIEVLYNLRCEGAKSMFDLHDVVVYIAQRIGLIPGRVWFGAGMAINAKLTPTQRRNFLRFLNRHELKQYLVFDDFHKKQPLRAEKAVVNDNLAHCNGLPVLFPVVVDKDEQVVIKVTAQSRWRVPAATPQYTGSLQAINCGRSRPGGSLATVECP